MTKTANLALLATLLAPAACYGGDREALIGTWKIVTFHDDGHDRLPRLGVSEQAKQGQPPRVAKLVFTAETCYVLRGDGKREVLAGLANCAWQSCRLDEQSDPKGIDLLGQPGKEAAPPKTYFGIYKLQGKQFTICWNETPKGTEPTKVRPKKLESDGDMNLFLCEQLSGTPEEPQP